MARACRSRLACKSKRLASKNKLGVRFVANASPGAHSLLCGALLGVPARLSQADAVREYSPRHCGDRLERDKP